MRTFHIFLVGAALTVGAAQAQAQCGTLTTTFASNNGFAGNMVDITPNADLEITDMDVNSGNVGGAVDIDLWYRNGTSFGNETNPLNDWVLIGSFSGTGAGQNLPTNIDMNGNGMTFAGGTLYGLFVDNTNYAAAGTFWYTNGQNTYSNADLTLDTNCGKGSGGFAGSTFFPRELNATINYCTGPGVPTMSISNLIAGQTTDISCRNMTPGGLVGIGYSITGAGPTTANTGPCGSQTVDLSNPIQILPLVTADAQGAVTVSSSVPAGTTGLSVWLHALDVGTCTLTNSLAEVIG